MAPLVFLNSTSNAWVCDLGVIAPGIDLNWNISFNTSNWMISSIGFIPDNIEVEVVYATNSVRSTGFLEDGVSPVVDKLTYFGTIRVNADFPTHIRAVGVRTII